MNIAGVPVEFIVATILRAMMPDFPTPVTMTRPLHFKISSTARTKLSSMRRSRSATDFASMRTTFLPSSITSMLDFAIISRGCFFKKPSSPDPFSQREKGRLARGFRIVVKVGVRAFYLQNTSMNVSNSFMTFSIFPSTSSFVNRFTRKPFSRINSSRSASCFF